MIFLDFAFYWGWPKKLNDYDKCQVIHTARKNRCMPLAELTNQTATKVSVTSIRWVLTAQGYHQQVAQKVPFLTLHHKHLWLVWAKTNKSLKSWDWNHVIFTDECYVWVSDKCGHIFVMWQKDEWLLERLVPTFKQSSVCVMFWGCITEGRKGLLVVMEYPGGKGGGMNSKCYQEQVLKGLFWDFYTCLKWERRSIQFQQDGALCHQSKSTIKWLDDHKAPLFFHPPKPPDLNPIEPLWLELKHTLCGWQHTPTTIEQLKATVLKAWEEILVDTINKHISKMPAHVSTVLAARGGHTRF